MRGSLTILSCLVFTLLLAPAALAGDFATPWCTVAADGAVPDGPPADTYTVVPFDLTRGVIQGDHGTEAEQAARAEQWNEQLLAGLEVRMADLGLKRAASAGEATGLVLMGEFLRVDAGNGKKRMGPGGQYGDGQASVYVLVTVVDAGAPDTALYQFYVYGFNQDNPGYAVTSIVSEAIPKAILKGLKKPSKAKAKKPAKKKLEEMQELQVETHGPAQ